MPSNTVTSYFQNENDALLMQNELPKNYINSIRNNELIFVRFSRGFDCLGIAEVNLSVKPLPTLQSDDEVLLCLNSLEPVLLSAGIVNGNSNDFTYLWSTGETTEIISVNAPGLFTVTVTDISAEACSNTRSIEVVPSNIATINNIDVVDASDNNSITIEVSGEGLYEFALDNINGPYQSSNTFNNVTIGVHTVFVRDIKNNCGIVSEEVFVLGFPSFFTPNGDGVNDLWFAKGFSVSGINVTSIQIFDRYGKLIKVLTTNSNGWDGTFNGVKMPTNDYWFVAQLSDGRTIRNHFTLKN